MSGFIHLIDGLLIVPSIRDEYLEELNMIKYPSYCNGYQDNMVEKGLLRKSKNTTNQRRHSLRRGVYPNESTMEKSIYTLPRSIISNKIGKKLYQQGLQTTYQSISILKSNFFKTNDIINTIDK